jgi:hypothetical protein
VSHDDRHPMRLTPHPLLRFLCENPALRRNPNPLLELPSWYRVYMQERLRGTAIPPTPKRIEKVAQPRVRRLYR